jgi:TolB-like protein/tetratricopeptide (TPR) repeat protein
MARILRDEPEPLERVMPDVSAPVRAIVERCLAKEPSGRYDGAHDLARDLASSRAHLRDAEVGTRVVPRERSRRLAFGAIALVAVLAVLISLLTRQRSSVPPPSTGSSRVQPAAAEPTSIAVLPFVNMSPDANQEYFSDGLSEELLNSLANVPQLRVISRTSSFQFKGKSEDIRTIGRKLNVANVLEGSVRKSGRRVRITAQLVNAATGSHLWSNTYDRDLDDIFRVQDDIARSVANASSVTLLGLEGKPSPSYGSNTEAYNFFLQAKDFARRGTREGLEKATEYYGRALKLDPGRAAYWVGLAGVHIRQVNHGFLPEAEGFRLSRAEVTRALELDPNIAEGHALLGWIRLTHDWDWAGAGASLKKALENGPGSAMVVGNAASLAAALGRLDEAIGLYRRATRLDPLNVAPQFNLSQAASDLGRVDEAEAALRRVLELNPDQPAAHAALGRLFLLRGKPQAAFAEIQKETLPSDRRQGLALAYHALGRTKEADASLAELIQNDGDSAALWIAEVYADRRDSDKAFEWLERAYAQHDPELAFVKGNRLLRNLEGDPRYRAFLRKMRLPG